MITTFTSWPILNPNTRIWLFTNYASPGTAQGQTGTNRDKQGHSLSVPAWPYLSLSVNGCPCLSLTVPVSPCMSLSLLVCPGLSLYVSIFAIPSCLPLHMNITAFISRNIATLTFLAKATVSMHTNLVFNFFLTFHLASSITLSFYPNSYILVIIYHRGLHLVSFMFCFCIVTFLLNING